MTKKRQRGRPRTENPRLIVFPINVTPEEGEKIMSAAELANKPRATWMREALLEAAGHAV